MDRTRARRVAVAGVVAVLVAACGSAVTTPSASSAAKAQTPTTTEASPSETPQPSATPTPTITPTPSATPIPTPEVTQQPITPQDLMAEGDKLANVADGRKMTFASFQDDMTAFYTAHPEMASVYPLETMMSAIAGVQDTGKDKRDRLDLAYFIAESLWAENYDYGADTSNLLIEEYVVGVRALGKTDLANMFSQSDHYLGALGL
jgi:hypothetical protein